MTDDWFFVPTPKTLRREPGRDDFIEAAFDIWRHKNRNIASSTLDKRFHSYFGVDIDLCVTLWNWIDDDLPKSAFYYHLLWALLFLKTYDSFAVLAGAVGCDEKTFQKWIWIVIEALSDCECEIVSVVVLVNHAAIFC